jgi:hypothetical protein
MNNWFGTTFVMKSIVKRVGMTVCLLFCALLSAAAFAGEVAIIKVVFEQRGDSWYVNTTLRHADTGWSHYADAWRVVDEKGKIFATRTLYHPHEHEQPFTRGKGDVSIPKDVSVVYVEAHDKEHGWSKQRVKVDLRKSKGERFEVRR